MKSIKDTPGRTNIEFVEKTIKEETAIQYCERLYPQTTKEFQKIMDEMYVTFCKKQRNYGPGNISVGSQLETDDDKKVALTGLWFRKNDKIQRLMIITSDGKFTEFGENLKKCPSQY